MPKRFSNLLQQRKRPSENVETRFQTACFLFHPCRSKGRVCRPEATHAFYAAQDIRAFPKKPKPRAWLVPHTLLQ
ncbi:hypothetical protein HMPREF9123_1308 [Neisseria bacilliformis ATCC BAA-1200]|uniref:Uncharacterized protein n=1 Tax=Neisseria bacilliformis ATCC BAA-1200 TaxID=888742 RepID=F2BC53_9NEIS|nr:hypothetical protein HMPREF9123_1308 [Neisseria bacilliformis ATCC BAA-1200]